MKKILTSILLITVLAFTAYPVWADEAGSAENDIVSVSDETASEEGTENTDLPEGFVTPTGKAEPGESVSESDAEGIDETAVYTTEPYIPENLTESTEDRTILGSDDRVRIYNSWDYPYSAIAYMCMKYQCGCEATGTGFMVGRNMLLTAAHCMICDDHSSPIEYVDFYFGCNGPYDYCYTYNGNFTYWYGTSFTSGSYTRDDEKRDYAYVRFDDYYPGNTTGWFGMSTTTESDLNWNVYQLTAYRCGELTTNSGTCSLYNDNVLTYTMDHLPGNSGGPVYGSDYYAIGICISSNDSANYAYRIKGWLIDEMRTNGLIAE